MKKIIFSLFALLFVASMAFANNEPKASKAQANAKNIDVDKSNVIWKASKVTGKHDGNVAIKNGTITTKDGKLTAADLTMDMTTIVCTDIKEAEWNGKLVGHLKGEDFFSTEKYPTAAFKLVKIEKVKTKKATDANYRLTADLTIKGITKQVVFPAMVNIDKDGNTTASAKMDIDRTQYDIKYGSSSFFDSLGDKAIDNKFQIEFSVATK